MNATKHAQKRMQQRSISENVLELLALYGLECHQSGESALYVLDKKARKTFKKMRDDLDKLLASKPVNHVESSEGDVITAFYRTRKTGFKYK